jgi:hypothetical protein
MLMNPAPASASDYALLRKAYTQKLGSDLARQRDIMASAAYKEGDPYAVTARYRLHFKPALNRPEDYEKLMATMKAGFVSQGKEGIVKARAVEDRLMRDTWEADGYDLLPKLQVLSIPTLVIAGDHDFIPGEIAEHIARAIPNPAWPEPNRLCDTGNHSLTVAARLDSRKLGGVNNPRTHVARIFCPATSVTRSTISFGAHGRTGATGYHKSAQARMPVLLNLGFFGRHDDFQATIVNWLSWWTLVRAEVSTAMRMARPASVTW